MTENISPDAGLTEKNIHDVVYLDGFVRLSIPWKGQHSEGSTVSCGRLRITRFKIAYSGDFLKLFSADPAAA
jgi:hypothetical protein